jgi:hypothetical protein
MSMNHYSQMLYQLSYAPVYDITMTFTNCTFKYMNACFRRDVWPGSKQTPSCNASPRCPCNRFSRSLSTPLFNPPSNPPQRRGCPGFCLCHLTPPTPPPRYSPRSKPAGPSHVPHSVQGVLCLGHHVMFSPPPLATRRSRPPLPWCPCASCRSCTRP